MFTFSRHRFNLSGTWRMMPDPYDVFEQTRFWEKLEETGRPIDHSPEEWPRIPVPSCWNVARPELEYYEGPAWYYKRFRFEKRRPYRYFLYFEAANYRTKVWINGLLLGEHEGGFTPFWFEVTEQLLMSNMIFVKVDNSRSPDSVPTLICDWFNFGGITRPAYVVAVPREHIANFKVSTRLDGGKTFVRFEAWTDGAADEPVKVTIPEANFVDTLRQGKRGYHDAEFEIYPDLWTPEKPRLYDVELSWARDTVTDRIGFREVRAVGEDILLNGKPTRLYGMCVHEEAHGKGRTLDEADVAKRFQWARELHCNFLRLAHYPHSEAMARAADKAGVLLWEEVPVYWKIAFENKGTLANAKHQMQALVERDWNRASVALWSIGNETDPAQRGRTSFMSALADYTRKLDPTRLVTAACYLDFSKLEAIVLDDPLAAKLDVVGVNEYFGWYEHRVADLERWKKDRKFPKPIIISETGCGTAPGHHGDKATRWTEEFQAEFYRQQMAFLDTVPRVKGVAPWILFDFRSPLRVNAWQRGYNRKGVLSDTGRKKLAFSVLSDFYAGKRGLARKPSRGPSRQPSGRRRPPGRRPPGRRPAARRRPGGRGS